MAKKTLKQQVEKLERRKELYSKFLCENVESITEEQANKLVDNLLSILQEELLADYNKEYGTDYTNLQDLVKNYSCSTVIVVNNHLQTYAPQIVEDMGLLFSGARGFEESFDKLKQRPILINKELNIKVEFLDYNKNNPPTAFCSKLLWALIIYFTSQSQQIEPSNTGYKIVIPKEELAEILGLAYETESQRKETNKKIRNTLTFLKHIEVTHKNRDKSGVVYEFKTSSPKTIEVVINSAFINSVRDNKRLNQIHKNLLKLPSYQSNAYNIGLKICLYYNMDKNNFRGEARRLQIKTILKNTSYKTIEECRAKELSWKHHILKFLDRDLETLVDQGIIKEFTYTGAKGKALNVEDVRELKSFGEFEQLYVTFVPVDVIDLEQRDGRKEKKAERIERAKKKRGRPKKKDNQ